MEADNSDFAKRLAEVLCRGDGSKLGEQAPAAIGGKHLLLYFSASWCPPCKMFTPLLAEWYTKKKKEGKVDFEIIFVSSDKTEAEFNAYRSKMPWLNLDFSERDLKGTLGQAFNVTGIPTLIVLDRDGSVITLDGRKKVMEDPDGFPWQKPATAVPGLVGQYENLASAIDSRRSTVLNADGAIDLAALCSDKGFKLSSDSDEQLMINLQFSGLVKLHSFRISGSDASLAPKKVKLFANRTLGFEDSDLTPTQSFVLDPKNTQPVLLNFVQYQKLSSLCIFIESNQGGNDVTVVNKIELFGVK